MINISSQTTRGARGESGRFRRIRKSYWRDSAWLEIRDLRPFCDIAVIYRKCQVDRYKSYAYKKMRNKL